MVKRNMISFKEKNWKQSNINLLQVSSAATSISLHFKNHGVICELTHSSLYKRDFQALPEGKWGGGDKVTNSRLMR